jgi:DNA-binding transcriptional regulator YiaG
LPFCHFAIKARKPKSADYPAAVNTLGDQLRAKRMDLGLLQREVATMLGVTEDTICYWENNRVRPSQLLTPKVLNFLKSPQLLKG